TMLALFGRRNPYNGSTQHDPHKAARQDSKRTANSQKSRLVVRQTLACSDHMQQRAIEDQTLTKPVSHSNTKTSAGKVSSGHCGPTSHTGQSNKLQFTACGKIAASRVKDSYQKALRRTAPDLLAQS
ncbi:hypothetical protein FB639_004502, partial [Coemansia asiatica]